MCLETTRCQASCEHAARGTVGGDSHQEEAIRLINPLWYLVALLIALGGWIAATVVAASAWDGVRDARVTALTDEISAEHRTVAIFTDILQPERAITCAATTGKDAEPVEVPASSLDITVRSDGSEWYLIGLLSDAPATMKVDCKPSDKRVDNASYGYAAVDGFDRAGTSRIISVVATVAAAVVAAWTFTSRRRRPAPHLVDR